MFSICRYSLYTWLICAFLFVNPSQLKSQTLSFQDTVGTDALEAFKDELTFKYRMFFESVLNIIDNDNSIFSRRNARYLIISLFENNQASVTDYLDNKYPETLTIKDYATRLFYLENKLPLFDKRYKFSDSIFLKPTFRNINLSKYGHLSDAEQLEKMYQVYEGEIFFLEEIISVQKVRKDVFDAIDRTVIKKLKISIRHDNKDTYKLYINSISILDPRNKLYDYKKIKEEIQTSAQAWSDAANPSYLEEIKAEALQRGIIIVKDHSKKAYMEDEGKQYWYYDAPKFYDYLLPGVGHLRFGSDKQRYRSSILYGGTFVASTGLAIFYNKKRKHYKHLYQESTDIETINDLKSRSENYKTKFLIATGASIGSYLSHMIHLRIKNNKQKNLIDKVIGQTEFKVIYNDFADTKGELAFSLKF